MSITDLVDEAKKKEKTEAKFSSIKLLNDHLWNLNFNAPEETIDRSKAQKGFHPSQLHGIKCVTKLMLGYFGAPQEEGEWEIDAKLRRIFDNGSHFHERIQENFAAMGVLRGTWKCRKCHAMWGVHPVDKSMYPITKSDSRTVGSVSAKPIPIPKKCSCGYTKFRYKEWRIWDEDSWIIGKTDGLMSLPEYTGLIGLEFKSINSFALKNLHEPYDKYMFQFNLYLDRLKVKRGIMIFEGKNDQDLVEFMFKKGASKGVVYEEKLGRFDTFKIKFKFQEVRDAIALCTQAKGLILSKKLPIDRFDSKDTACRRCSFRKFCKNLKSFKALQSL